MKNKIQEECNKLSELLIRKNQDYGNSAEQSFEKYGLTAVLIRIEDKINRLANLNKGNAAQVKESLTDTLQDIAGYAILGKILVEESQKIKCKLR